VENKGPRKQTGVPHVSQHLRDVRILNRSKQRSEELATAKSCETNILRVS